ncbi:MAG: nuclear transport factor 2 family protein [Microthrixaceae bacterium]
MTDHARQIENLIHSYAERIDSGDFGSVAELFRHGRIQAAPDVVFEGAEAVRGMYESTTRIHHDGTPRTKHVITNVTIEVAEDGCAASARSYYTVFQATDELPLQAIIAGRYGDTFQVVEGEWCFDTREMFVDLTGDLSHHLLFEL